MGEGSGRRRDLTPYVAQVQARWMCDDPKATFRVLPGTLVFADVSGFTPLTERLSRQGRVGAERLTDVLNDVFARLLGAASAWGGDLLKFGGDALLLLFTGADHERRAAGAAMAMQDELRPFRRFRTEAGTVSLRMSVGAAAGDVQAILVGSSHRELLVVGPVVSETARLEAEADAGEVLVSPALAAHLTDQQRGRERAGGVLLRAVADARPPEGALGRSWPDRVGAGVPASIREHLGGTSREGEHRLAALAFVQFKGTDDLLAAEGLPRVADELSCLVERAQAACAENGVSFLATDLDRNGGKIVLVAGAPVATPDDADRMLFALRDIVAAPTALEVRAGVNRGYAFAVDMGVPARRTYAVMGDATNLAARVMGKAPMGSVLATEAVLGRLRTRFALEPLEPFLVKGKTEPVRAAVVGPPEGVVADRDATPLVGRSADLAELRRGLTAARRGEGGAVALVGEAGVGKSRIAQELRAVAGEGTAVVEVQAGVYARNSPYFALRRPLRRLLGVDPLADDATVEAALRRTAGEMATEVGPWLPLLDALVGLDLPPTREVASLDPQLRAVRLRALAADLFDHLLPGPTLVLVEDAQWLDDATTGVLSFVLNGIESRPWFVVVTGRDGSEGLRVQDGPRRSTRRLEGLSLSDADALVEAVLDAAGGELSPHVRQAIVERGGGSPLLLRELTRSTLEGHDVTELPDTIEGVLAARIDVLPDVDRELLRRVSVLGSRVARHHLEAMTDVAPHEVEQAVERLEPLLARQPNGDLEFRQSIVREIAYASLPFRRRRELHARAAVVIEASVGDDLDEWSDLLSLHCAEGNLHEKAWRYGRVAGDRASSNAAPLDAIAFYQRALRASRQLDDLPGDEVAALWERLGEVAELGGRYDVAADAYAEARRRCRDDVVALARLHGREGRLRERSGRSREALTWLTKGQRVLDRAGPGTAADPVLERLRADLLVRSGGTRLRQGYPLRSIALLEEAVLRAQAVGDQALLAHAYYLLDWAYSDLGRPEAAAYRTLALPIYEALGDHAGVANVLNNLGVSAYYEGRWADALELYERSRVARAKAGDLVEMGTAANNVGEILSDQGLGKAAVGLFREALAIWRPSAFQVGVGLATSNLGRAAARAGRFDEAAEHLRTAVDLLDEVGAEFLGLEARARQVERLAFMADPAALDEAEALIERIGRTGGHAVLLAMADRLAGLALGQRGRRAEALDRVRASIERARRLNAPFEVALGRQVEAALDPGASDAAAEASQIFASLSVVSTPPVPLRP